MADGTKRTSHYLGAASLEQKLARPASEVVRELLHRRGGDPRTPSCSAREKGEGTQVPNYSARTVSSCSWFFPQQSFRLGLATLAQGLVDYSCFSSSGCGCHCATSISYDGFDAVPARRRCKRDNGSFRIVLFSVLSLSPRRISSLHRALRALAVCRRQ